MEEINQNPTLSTVPKRVAFFSLRKLFLILAGILILVIVIVISVMMGWLGRTVGPLPPLGMLNKCQRDTDC